jgi:hypothetical protein
MHFRTTALGSPCICPPGGYGSGGAAWMILVSTNYDADADDLVPAKKRRTSLPRLGPAQVRRVVDQA